MWWCDIGHLFKDYNFGEIISDTCMFIHVITGRNVYRQWPLQIRGSQMGIIGTIGRLWLLPWDCMDIWTRPW